MKKKKEVLENLIQELSMILSKRSSLEFFIRSSGFKKLTHIESVLLYQQKEAMDSYINSLDCRISLYSQFNRKRFGKWLARETLYWIMY